MLFKKYGTITDCYIPMEQLTNRLIAYIVYEKAYEAARAVEECGKSYDAKFEFGSVIVRRSLLEIVPYDTFNKENEQASQKNTQTNSTTSTIFKNITNTSAQPQTSNTKRVLSESNLNEIPLKKRKVISTDSESTIPIVNSSNK